MSCPNVSSTRNYVNRFEFQSLNFQILHQVDSSYRPTCCQNPDAAAGPCAGMGVHFDDPEKLAEDPSAVMPCVGCGLGLNSDCASAVAASMSAAQVDVDEFDASLCDALATTRELKKIL